MSEPSIFIRIRWGEFQAGAVGTIAIVALVLIIIVLLIVVKWGGSPLDPVDTRVRISDFFPRNSNIKRTTVSGNGSELNLFNRR
jgi:hypothetical protein